MSNRFYTVLIVPERSSHVRRLKIPRQLVINILLGVFVLFGGASFMVVHYLHMVDQVSENSFLKADNLEMKQRLLAMRDRAGRIERVMERIEQFDVKVRAITQLNDAERNLAMGPLSADGTPGSSRVLYAEGERMNQPTEPLDSKLAMRLLDSKLEHLEDRAQSNESALRDLSDYLDSQKILLRTTPSIWPLHSRLKTSAFGIRHDPYTRKRVMHKGLDVAAPNGSEVLSPADGVVIWTGNRGGYGKCVVIDHGFGVQTHYAHLDDYDTKLGARVKRGQLVGRVGNTGRSTGPHLHYEVRFNGIPQDPAKFMLD